MWARQGEVLPLSFWGDDVAGVSPTAFTFGTYQAA